MKITFTDIRWRNSDDSDAFNMHALQSIELQGLTDGIVTIECATNKFQAPFCNCRTISALPRLEFVTKHPHYDSYIQIAIFDSGKVAVVAESERVVPEWFKNKCKNFVATF